MADGDVTDSLTAPVSRAIVLGPTMILVNYFPVFLVGTLAVFLRNDLHFGTGRLGLALAAPPAAMAICAIPTGRLVERIGVTKGLRIGIMLTTLAMVGGSVATTWGLLVLCLLVTGVATAFVEPSVTLWMARDVPRLRQGLAFGLKQAASPAASVLAGFALPAIAVTLGWRWVFVSAGVLGAVAMLLIPRHAPAGKPRTTIRRGGDVSLAPLVVLSASTGIGMAAILSFTGFVVTAAVRSGMSSSLAGILFACGATIGIAARVGMGAFADRRETGQIKVVVTMLLIGATSLVLMAPGETWLIVIAVPIAFSMLWGWPGLVFLLIVRTNSNAPAAAASIVMMGGAIGCCIGPVVFGLVAGWSYPAAWLIASALPVVSAAGMLLARRMLRAHFEARPSPTAADETSGQHAARK